MMSRMPDLSVYPGAVVVRLEVRARTLRGVKTLFGLKSPTRTTPVATPNGLLHHDTRTFVGFHAPRVIMRWYWRDAASLDSWAKDTRHGQWWVDLMKTMPAIAIRIETRHTGPGAQSRR